ncbi:cobalamin biosynthesis protein [Halobaculum sp. D14]|uniref:cobalamin biosynthesis protein n=1 Tax=unclassified Halobaculum TaxID=2640896 RepID=UPI003EB7CEBA
MSTEPVTPDSLIANHPETAYFWGHVAGAGRLRENSVTVETTDEAAAERLVAIADGGDVDHRSTERRYAHDTSITRSADEYTVQVFGDLARRAAAAFGLPLDGEAGGYRFDSFDGHERQLLRGLVESSGTVCFKSSSGTVGVSFVHPDRRLLERIRTLLADVPVDAPADEVSEASSGYWFGVADEAVPELGPWLYEGAAESGLFAPSRRRKLRRSLEEAAGSEAWCR